MKHAKTDEKKMTDAINAIVQLNFKQLLILQQHLAEHLVNIWLHKEAEKLKKEH